MRRLPKSTGSALRAELAERLRQNARKLTAPRRVILEILHRSEHPMSAKDVFRALPARSCDLATVYRSLRLLETTGMVKRFHLGDGVARFELLDEGDDGHHHHLVCTRCTTVVEIEECVLRELEEGLASRNGFRDVTHRLEFFGVCPACQHQTGSSLRRTGTLQEAN